MLADCLKAFSLPLIKGNKVGVICRSGGHAVMLADAVHRHGFALAEFSDHIYDHVRKEIRARSASGLNTQLPELEIAIDKILQDNQLLKKFTAISPPSLTIFT